MSTSAGDSLPLHVLLVVVGVAVWAAVIWAVYL